MSKSFGTTHALCPECQQDVYPGMHGTGCSRGSDHEAGIPVALRHQVLLPPLEPCEWCNLHTPPQDYYGRTGRKPVGQACELCGNAAPKGTYPMPPRWTGTHDPKHPDPAVTKGHTPPRAPQWQQAVA